MLLYPAVNPMSPIIHIPIVVDKPQRPMGDVVDLIEPLAVTVSDAQLTTMAIPSPMVPIRIDTSEVRDKCALYRQVPIIMEMKGKLLIRIIRIGHATRHIITIDRFGPMPRLSHQEILVPLIVIVSDARTHCEERKGKYEFVQYTFHDV
jgi:hypothetical protein